MFAMGPEFFNFIKKLEENGDKLMSSVSTPLEQQLDFEFNNSTCHVCNGYYGPSFGEPVCVTCHAFLFPDFPSYLPSSYFYSEKTDDGDSGNDEPSDLNYSSERKVNRTYALPNWLYYRNSLDSETSPEDEASRASNSGAGASSSGNGGGSCSGGGEPSSRGGDSAARSGEVVGRCREMASHSRDLDYAPRSPDPAGRGAEPVMVGHSGELTSRSVDPMGRSGEFSGRNGEPQGQNLAPMISLATGRIGEPVRYCGDPSCRGRETVGRSAEPLGRVGEPSGRIVDPVGRNEDPMGGRGLMGRVGELVGYGGELMGRVGEMAGRGNDPTGRNGDLVINDGSSDRAGLGPPPQPPCLVRSLQALSVPRPPDNLADGLVEQLPSEVLLCIFSYLDDLSLCACACVCARWWRLVRARVAPPRWAAFTARRFPLYRPMLAHLDWHKKYQALVESCFCRNCLVQMCVQAQPAGEENAWRRNRLRIELKMLRNDPPEGIAATPLDAKCCHWQASVTGPVGSPYEGGIFYLYIQVPYAYPMSPPVVRFLTRILHPNISRHGDVGIDSVHHNWSLALTISKVLISIQSLLTDPYTAVCMEPELGEMYVRDRQRFETLARNWTWRYAMHDILPH